MSIEELNNELKQLKDEKYHLLKLINHDIRSPFNRMFALLQLFELDSDSMSEQQTEYLDSMYLSILSGLEMIQNLRDMREIDAGHIEITNTPIQVDDVIQGAIRSFSKQIELKKVGVKFNHGYLGPEVMTDSYYLQRIVENVLSNAIKFSKEDAEVLIHTRANADLLEIEIRDFGEGIRSSEESKLFDKFEKLSSYATGGEGSLGLGLYNSTSIIKMMNGILQFNRAVEPGSSFTIILPIKPI